MFMRMYLLHVCPYTSLLSFTLRLWHISLARGDSFWAFPLMSRYKYTTHTSELSYLTLMSID
eukprot:1961995-Prorocentrum_lima.AAC.1